MKFKIGDDVVLKEYLDRKVYIVQSMNPVRKLDGSVFPFPPHYNCNNRVIIGVVNKDDRTNWGWSFEDEFKLVYRVGQQLEFDFMKG